MLKHARGNILDMAEAGLFDVVVQGCNGHNVMGSGLAKEIKARFPRAFQADQLAHQQWRHPVAKLGNFSHAAIHHDKHDFVIINAYTQVDYLPRGMDHFEYGAFEIILRKLDLLAKPGVRFGFPYIGMGLAGGDREVIIPMIEKFAVRCATKGAEVTLVEFA